MSLFYGKFIIESDFSNATCCLSFLSVDPWKFYFILVEIKSSSSLAQVTFKHKRGFNWMADALTNQEYIGRFSLVAPIFYFLMFSQCNVFS